MRHFIFVGWLAALAGCGTLKAQGTSITDASFTCRGRPPPPRTSISRSDIPVGRLELKRLPSESQPTPASALPTEEATVTTVGAKLPAARFRLMAEAVPIGSLGAALASELAMSVVVAAPLVDLRVSHDLGSHSESSWSPISKAGEQPGPPPEWRAASETVISRGRVSPGLFR